MVEKTAHCFSHCLQGGSNAVPMDGCVLHVVSLQVLDKSSLSVSLHTFIVHVKNSGLDDSPSSIISIMVPYPATCYLHTEFSLKKKKKKSPGLMCLQGGNSKYFNISSSANKKQKVGTWFISSGRRKVFQVDPFFLARIKHGGPQPYLPEHLARFRATPLRCRRSCFFLSFLLTYPPPPPSRLHEGQHLGA